MRTSAEFPPIRPVTFTLGRHDGERIPGSVLDVSTFADLVDRHGRQEFVGPQRLDFSLLLFVSSGYTTHWVDFVEYPLTSGDVLWVRAGQVQQWGAISDIVGDVVCFSPEIVPENIRSVVRHRARNKVHWPRITHLHLEIAAGIDFIRALAAGLRAEEASGARTMAISAALTAMLISLTNLYSSTISAPLVWRLAEFESFLDLIDGHLGVALTAQDAAHALNLSAKTLERICRLHSGVSAKKLIDEQVLIEAKRLLAYTTLPVAAVGRRLGRPDPAVFSRYFSRLTGFTPGEFRRQHTTSQFT